ncbi:hypothetical protein F4Z99_09070 [Candidatus Poribacteria bacterium]|nr:hypothetical protein [Candidatus Poribacteria bacterium]
MRLTCFDDFGRYVFRSAQKGGYPNGQQPTRKRHTQNLPLNQPLNHEKMAVRVWRVLPLSDY